MSSIMPFNCERGSNSDQQRYLVMVSHRSQALLPQQNFDTTYRSQQTIASTRQRKAVSASTCWTRETFKLLPQTLLQ